MKILVTGCAGFIGFHLTKKLCEFKKYRVYGIDNLNTYYDLKLKKDRLKILQRNKLFKFFKIDISNNKKISENFSSNKYDIVIHLAAQAGVRYSITNPETYIRSNLIGFYNVIENSKKIKIKHFIFASSSSVYGDQKRMPFKEEYKCERPLSFYAATKISNENLAFSYSNIFDLNCTGLRLFTVYGPYGRPDMALYKFTTAIFQNKKIELFNNGIHSRDFTYIDDAVNAIFKIVESPKLKKLNFEILNIASGKKIKLLKFLEVLEKEIGINAKIKKIKIQKGDVLNTFANISKLSKIISYKPSSSLESGIKNYIDWYKSYYL
tara:strand:+ start:706 stop:1671 length:966 start_codon:yes stop_codon:yes gene_type:complete